MTLPCKICQAPTEAAFQARVLDRYDATYSRCTGCGFMAAEDVHWLDEAYAEAINDIDLGVVNRATSSSRMIEGLLLSSFERGGRFVDYGAGYGVLVRLMRDRGFDFFWQDRYCENLFAKHFEAAPGDRFEVLTAFEVFEHLVDPLAEVAQMLELSDNLLFSTLVVPADVTPDWWYFGPDHGQHIAFYTRESLQRMADHFGLHLCSDDVGTHLLSRKPVSEKVFTFFARQRLPSKVALKVLRRRLRAPSLLEQDFTQVSGYSLS